MLNTTRMELIVEVSHQDTTSPNGAIDLVVRSLNFPAIQKVEVRHADTNWRLFQEPSEVFIPVVLL